MAETTSQLQRIADLVSRAGAISKKQRGMRIEAEEWNSLVEILLGVLQIERLQEHGQQAQLEERFAPRAHEHLGEVSLAWLDADLQSRVGGGGGVSTREVLADMDRKILGIRDQVTSLQTVVDTHQRALDRSAVDELDRSKTLRDFQSRFDGVANLKTLVGTLSSDVGGLRKNVDTVLELKKSLSDPQGNPIDVGGIRKDLSDLQKIRESLNGIDGKPLTMRDIEIRLTDVSNVVGVGGTNSLDRRFAEFGTTFEGRVIETNKATIAEGLAGIRGENAVLETKLRSEIKTSATEISSASSAETTRQITVFSAQQKTSLDERFTTNNASISASTLEAARGIVSQRMAEVPEIARAAAQAAAGDVGRSVTADLQTKFTAEIAAQIKVSETKTDTRLKPLEADVPELRNSLPGLVALNVQASTTALQTTLSQQVTAQIATAQQQLQAGLAIQVTSTVNASLSNLDTRINSAVAAQTPAINARISETVTAATKSLNEQVTSEVGRQIIALNLDAKISNTMQAESREIQTLFSGQLASQEARLTTLINKTANTVRGENRALIDSSLAQSRTEILSTVDTKIGTSRPAIDRPGGIVIR